MNDSPSRSHAGWLAIGGVLTAAVIVIGGAYVWALLGRQTTTEQQTYRQPVDRIEIDMRSSDVTLVAGATDQVVVDRELTKSFSAPEVNETWNGKTLRITSGCPAGFRLPGCSVRYLVRVPPQIAVDAKVSSGTLSVGDVGGDLRLATTSGDVRVTNAQGNLWARATSGSVTATGVRSSATDVETTSGGADLRFAAAPQNIRAKVSSGDLGIAVPPDTAYNVQASTDSGDQHINVRQDRAAPGTISAETSSGDVTIGYGGS
jgi:hypothetical protein